MISRFNALIILMFLLSCTKDNESNNGERYKNKIKQEFKELDEK